MAIKAYEDLTIQDNFLFQKIMRNKRICQRVIERLLDIEVLDIVYQEEEKSIDVRLDSKSIRLDVYVNDENGTVFNIEMQTTRDMYELSKRTRYYQALIDIDLLEKGQKYKVLNDTYIIFICSFPVFDGQRHKYTFRNLCVEEHGIELKDGATKLFLSTKGDLDDISRPLKNFLDYVDGQAPADELMQEIDVEIDIAKKCDEWRRDYMTFYIEKELYGEQQRAEGEAKGRAEGRAEERIDAIKSLMGTMKWTAQQAMQALNIPASEYEKYLALI